MWHSLALRAARLRVARWETVGGSTHLQKRRLGGRRKSKNHAEPWAVVGGRYGHTALSTAPRRVGAYGVLHCREGCRLTGCSGRYEYAPAELPQH